MGIYAILTLFIILFALALMPSASVALVIMRSATLGVAEGIATSLGIVLGDLFFIFTAIAGLSFIAETMGGLFLVVKYLGACYLLWFGYGLLTKKVVQKPIPKGEKEGNNLFASFLVGLALTLGDLKAIVFYVGLLPAFVDLSSLQTLDILILALVATLGVGSAKIAYVFLANKIFSLAQGSTRSTAAQKVVGGMSIGIGGYLFVNG